MAIQVTVNMVTTEVVVNSQDIQCSVNAAPVQAEINCCGNGLLGVPGTGDTGDILTKPVQGLRTTHFYRRDQGLISNRGQLAKTLALGG